MTFPARGRLALAAMAMTAALASPAAGAAAPQSIDPDTMPVPKARGKDEAPGANVVCMRAVKKALPHPDTFKWANAKYRRVAEDAYDVVADVEFVGANGETRKGKAQCDVFRVRGDEFIAPRVRLPK